MRLVTLHPDHDERLFRTAWRWRLAYPPRVRQWDGLRHFRQWFALMKRRVSVGVFTDRLLAIVTFRPNGNGVYEVHIDCERGTDIAILLTALMSIEPTVFEQWGATEIFGGVISRNRGILRIAEDCGYHRDGVEQTVGRHKWVRVSKTYVQYQNREGNVPNDEHLWPDARSRVA